MITATPRPATQRQQRSGRTQRTQRTQGLLGDRTASTGKGVNASNLRDTRSSGQGFGSSSLRRNSAGKGTGGGFGASNLRSSNAPATNAAPKNAVQPFRRPQTGAPNSGFTPLGDTPKSPGSGGATIGKGGGSTNTGGIGKGLKSAIGRAGLGVNAAGEVSAGIYGGGVGLGVSTSGKIDLGIGVASVSWNFQNPNESSLGFGFNTMTITGVQTGCTVTLFYKVLGQVVNTETRQADECSGGGGEDETQTPGNNPNTNHPDPPSPGTVSRSTNTTRIERDPDEISEIKVGFDSVQTFLNYATPATDISYINDGSEVYAVNYFGLKRENRSALHPTENPNSYLVTGSFDIVQELYSYRVNYFFETDPNGEYVPRDSNGIPQFHLKKKIPYSTAFISVLFRQTTYTIKQNDRIIVELPYRDIDNIVSPNFNLSGIAQMLQDTKGDIPLVPLFPFLYVTDIKRVQSIIVQLDPVPEPTYMDPNADPRANVTTRLKYIIKSNKPKYQPKIHSNRGTQMEPNDKQQIMLDRIYYMLGGDAFFDEGLAVPNELFTPEADGNLTKAKTYNEAVNLLFRTIDHRTPAQINFPLPNGAEYTSINAQGYFADLGKNVSELLEKTSNTGKADNSEVIGYMHRVSLINTQIFNLLIKINELVKGIVGFLGIPMRETTEIVDIPFDPTMKGKLAKGFGSSKDLDKELEKLLKESNASEEKIKEAVARYATSGQIPVRVKKLRQSKEGGDFWWLLRNGLNLKK